MKSLAGMWAFISGDDHYHYGKIEKATEEYIMIRLDTCEHIPSSLTLHSLVELSDTPNVLFFETKEKLDLWLEWINSDPNSHEAKDTNIVKIRKDN